MNHPRTLGELRKSPFSEQRLRARKVKDELRDNLVPLNRKYPLAELLDACNRYLAHAPRVWGTSGLSGTMNRQ